jgi:Sec-independent protein secretion pathway component TatC
VRALGAVFEAVLSKSTGVIFGLGTLEISSVVVVVVLGSSVPSSPPNVFLQLTAAIALFLLFAGGPLCLILWVKGRRYQVPSRTRSEIAGVIAVVLTFVTAASTAVVLLAPYSS